MDDTAPPGGIGTWEGNMPIPVATGNIVQVLIQGTIEQQQCENVIYFRAQAADTDLLLNLLAKVATCMLAMVPILNPSYTLERIKGKIVSPAVGLEDEWTPEPTDNVTGEAAGDGLPSYCAALISLRTLRPGRSGKGRMYIAGVPEGATTLSNIIAGSPMHTALAAFAACMLTTFALKDVPAGGDYEWGIMSRKIGGAKPPFLPAGFAGIVDARVNIPLATMRTRKVGRGR
jgi:hypothetical protein